MMFFQIKRYMFLHKSLKQNIDHRDSVFIALPIIMNN